MSSNLIFKRCLSTTTQLAQQVRPPIQVYGIEGKYASALYSCAYKQKSLETVDKDLHKIKDLYNNHKDFNVSFYRYNMSSYRLCPLKKIVFCNFSF